MKSIWQKPKIEVGDLVIGRSTHRWEGTNSESSRLFIEPSMVLEIKSPSALVFVENSGPAWYNLHDLEKVYAKTETPEEPKTDVAKDR